MDPKTGRTHKININKSSKTNIYDNQFFYQNEEFARKMREKDSNQSNYNNNYHDSCASNTNQNSYEDVKNENPSYGFKNRNYPDNSSFYYKNNEDSYVVAFGVKHYFTFVFIFVTFVSFFIFIKRNPPQGDPFFYKNSVYYPKDQDPILRGLIKTNKIDAYQLDKMNYTGNSSKYYD